MYIIPLTGIVLPCTLSHHPAKYLKILTTSTNSNLVLWSAFPVSMDSKTDNSSRFFSIKSEKYEINLDLSYAEIYLHSDFRLSN